VTAIKHGAYDYITKPCTGATLLAKLECLRAAHPWATDGEGGPPPSITWGR